MRIYYWLQNVVCYRLLSFVARVKLRYQQCQQKTGLEKVVLLRSLLSAQDRVLLHWRMIIDDSLSALTRES